MLYRSQLKSVSLLNTALVLVCAGMSAWFLWPKSPEEVKPEAGKRRQEDVRVEKSSPLPGLTMFGGWTEKKQQVKTKRQADVKICGIACSDSGANWAVLSSPSMPGQTVVRAGDVFCGLTIVGIKPGGVEFKNTSGGRVEKTFAMFGHNADLRVEEQKGTDTNNAAGNSVAVEGENPPVPGKSQNAAKGLSFDIEKTKLLSHLASLPDILASATIIPFYQSGKSCGYMLYGMKPDSVFKRIGLKDGDIVTHCNGVKLTRNTTPGEFIGMLRKNPVVQILVRRDSATISISYSLR